MKFFCTKENINNSLGLIGNIATKNTSLPILNNILMKSVTGGIQLTTTNLEMAATTIVRGRVEGDGSTTVNAKLFIEAVSLLPDEKVEISLEEGFLIISCGRSRTSIKTTSTEDFPVIPQIKKENIFTINTEKLSQAISSIIFAVNPDEARPEISGVFLGNVNNKLTIVGTDSYRLAEAVLGPAINQLSTEGIIIPLKTAQEVGRISQTYQTEEVEVFIDENQILWQVGETEIISRLISGQYPDYLQIIPKNYITEAMVEKNILQQAVRAASLFVRSGINDVKLKFVTNKGLIEVSSTNSQLGENLTSVISQIQGETTEIIFNYRYLLDGLAAINSKEVKISIAGNNQPCVFEPKKVGDYRYLIMPIRQ